MISAVCLCRVVIRIRFCGKLAGTIPGQSVVCPECGIVGCGTIRSVTEPTPVVRTLDALLSPFVSRLVKAGLSALEFEPAPAVAAPATVYHFTDASGLLGILEQGQLWASYAGCLNDLSELRYGIETTLSALEQAGSASDVFRMGLRDCLAGRSTLDARFVVHWRPYVISFCEREDSAAHWLHYGRDGTGCAVRLRVGAIAHQSAFVRVLYDAEEQKQMIDAILQSVYSTLRELLERQDEPMRSALIGGAIHMASTVLSAAAVRLKHPSFSAEREWRLVRYDMVTNGVQLELPNQLPTHWRVTRNRIVPYKRIPLRTPFLEEVVLGRSAPMDANDVALQMLLNAAGYPGLPLRTSAVPVRP